LPNKEYYKQHREESIAKATAWQKNNHERYLARLRSWRAKIKHEAMLTYSNGTGLCVKCNDAEAIELHHLDGTGEQHRADINRSRQGGITFYLKLRDLGWPGGMIATCKKCHNELDRELGVGAPQRKTTCKRGHARTPDNVNKSNGCKACERESYIKRRELQRQEQSKAATEV
jgi:hypothetical protein